MFWAELRLRLETECNKIKQIKKKQQSFMNALQFSSRNLLKVTANTKVQSLNILTGSTLTSASLLAGSTQDVRYRKRTSSFITFFIYGSLAHPIQTLGYFEKSNPLHFHLGLISTQGKSACRDMITEKYICYHMPKWDVATKPYAYF